MKHYIEIHKKKYEYSITPIADTELGEDISLFVCEAANIRQEFENADIPALLEDLGNLILSEQAYRVKNSALVRFRLTPYEKSQIQKNTEKYGYKNMSDFLKDIALHPERQRVASATI